jgi:aromatic ring hydroxylase
VLHPHDSRIPCHYGDSLTLLVSAGADAGRFSGGPRSAAAFRNAAHTVAAIYDMKADSANREIMSFTDGGEECSMYYLRARTQEDLRRRMRAHRMIADIPNRLRKKNADG